MAKIAGVTLLKNGSGKVTHVKMSKKYFAKMVEDFEDAMAMEKESKGDTIPWDEARQKLNKKFGFKD